MGAGREVNDSNLSCKCREAKLIDGRLEVGRATAGDLCQRLDDCRRRSFFDLDCSSCCSVYYLVCTEAH